MKDIKLNESLLKKQQINEETELGIKAVHTMLGLVLDSPELVGIDSASETVRGLEFALQKLWNFPQNENYHRYQFVINGCDCPKLDNEDMFLAGRPDRYYNMECRIHNFKIEPKKTKKTKPTKLTEIHNLIDELFHGHSKEEIELASTLLKMFPELSSIK